MARSFPPDVFFCDHESLLFARFARGRGNVRLTASKRYPLPEGTFAPGMLTPALVNPQAITDTLLRVRREQGRIDRASLLLPDTWFRMAVFDLPTLPARKSEADEVVQWSLRKTLPARPEEFRTAHQIARTADGGARALVVGAMEKTVLSLEAAFGAAQVGVALIEPAGLNLWNAITAREPLTPNDRILFYLRDRDFTSALFRAGHPLFVRSRSVGEERTLLQEIRLSASYFRANLRSEKVDCCYVASGNGNGEFASVIAEEFEAPMKRITLREHIDAPSGIDTRGVETEIIACSGVFTS
jgi:hypothetical protein